VGLSGGFISLVVAMANGCEPRPITPARAVRIINLITRRYSCGFTMVSVDVLLYRSTVVSK